MNRRYSDPSSGGWGLFSVFQIVLVVLKFIGVVNWEWIWVLSPLWISLSVWLVAAVVIMIVEFVKLHLG